MSGLLKHLTCRGRCILERLWSGSWKPEHQPGYGPQAALDLLWSTAKEWSRDKCRQL